MKLTFFLPLLCAVPLAIGIAQERPVVTTVQPVHSQGDQTFAIPGRTEPFESASLFTRATGIVKERKFDIGDSVKKDEIVALIDAQEIDHAVDAARANLDQAVAKAKNGQNLADRARKLHGSRAVSFEEYEGRLASLEELEAAVRQARAELARLEVQQSFATVRSPFDGVVTARNFDRGDHVRGDSASTDRWLYRLSRLDQLRFSIHASPDLALRLATGSGAEITFREFPGQMFTAKVDRSSRTFDTATGTMRVELLLENPGLKLPAGLTGVATFRLPPAKDSYLVPTNALSVREGKTTLAVVKEGTIAFQEILPGRNLGRQVEVTSPGLSTQTLVVINPNAMLREGEAVEATPFQPSGAKK